MHVNREQMIANAHHCAAQNIVIPTFAQLADPSLIEPETRASLKEVGLWDPNPANLFRITWKNEPVPSGGTYGGVNFLEIPSHLSGTRARIIGLTGHWFPTGAHKVGATFGCLVPPLVTGLFDPKKRVAAWPSTGNYCRGGAYVSKLLGCASLAILPEGMSRERFQWLADIAGEVIKTPGGESNVKEIFDTCWQLRNTRPEVTIFNQFEAFGNTLWHHRVTGPAMEEAIRAVSAEGDRFAGCVLSSGSGGTLASGYYLKKVWPQSKLAVAEALQCPTLLNNGFGDHRIEGIGDKHVPFIHDVKRTDMVIAVDDALPIRTMRLFNEPAGHQVLAEHGVHEDLIAKLPLMGISGLANMIAAAKFAKYYELDEHDVVVTVFTDSMNLYGSRLEELREQCGPYESKNAYQDLAVLHGTGIDHALELGYYDRKRIHNLKYFTWVEQQGHQAEELHEQWFDHDRYWSQRLDCVDDLDRQIQTFNGLIQKIKREGKP